MNKFIGILAGLLIVGVFIFKPSLFSANRVPGMPTHTPTSSLGSLLPDSIPSLKLPPIGNQVLAQEAWTTFQNYIKAAKSHDLEELEKYSHQISATCQDKNKEASCIELMDSVTILGESLKGEDFKNVESDGKQVVIFTEGPDRVFIYFTRPENDLNVLAIRICSDNEEGVCVKANIDKTDSDSDGWWNSTELFFR